MIHSWFVSEHLVSYCYDRIIVPKRAWVKIAAEQVGNIHLLTVLNIHNKQFLDQGLFGKNCLDIENIYKVTESDDEVQLVQLLFVQLPLEFVSEEHALRPLFIHIDFRFLIFLHFYLLVHVAALFISKNVHAIGCVRELKFQIVNLQLLFLKLKIITVITTINILMKEQANAFLHFFVRLSHVAYSKCIHFFSFVELRFSWDDVRITIQVHEAMDRLLYGRIDQCIEYFHELWLVRGGRWYNTLWRQKLITFCYLFDNQFIDSHLLSESVVTDFGAHPHQFVFEERLPIDLLGLLFFNLLFLIIA